MLSSFSRFLFGSPEKPEEKWQSGEANYAYGHPIQGYNLPSAQPPPMNENKPQIRDVKKITRDGDLNMGNNSGVECNYEDMNQQPDKPFTQADWGKNEPIIQGCDEIGGKGKINMGSNSGSTISYGKRAAK